MDKGADPWVGRDLGTIQTKPSALHWSHLMLKPPWMGEDEWWERSARWLEPYPARSGFIVPWQADLLAVWRMECAPRSR